MLTTNFAGGFGANYTVTGPETVYPPFTQSVVFTTATAGTRIKLPNYVNTIRVYAWGGGGAGGGRGPNNAPLNPTPTQPGARPGGVGGDGGFVQGDFPIPPGGIIYVRVAGGGSAPGSSSVGGSGGGYSSVELPPAIPAKYLVVAGGGGGGGRAPQLTSRTPWSGDPQGYYYPGYAGGPAYSNGVSPANLYGLAGSISSGGNGGYQPIGEVPVPTLGPYYGPIYGPLPPSSGPTRRSGAGSFLTGGGDPGGSINGGGSGFYTIPPPAWSLPSAPPAQLAYPFHPGYQNYSYNSGGGGAGYYGGGAGHPREYVPGSGWFGDAGGGGGSSYINPTGANTAMANTGPYSPNPYYATYYSPTNKISIGGLGYTPPGASWSAEAGGDGLVVIVY